MSDTFLLPALAPWPTLLSFVSRRPRRWVIWGELPPRIARRFESLGVEVDATPLPRPFHRGELPPFVRRSWRGIVVPALGAPLPSRWPVLRRLAELSCPLFVASHGTISRAPRRIPPFDAFAWALDRLQAPPDAPSGQCDGAWTCVRADLLGDLLLSLPAIASLAGTHPVRLAVRQEWTAWVELLAGPNVSPRGLTLEPWTPPAFEACTTALDMSPPGWRSPLTPALARAVPAKVHRRIGHRGQRDGLSAMIGRELGLDVSWPSQSPRRSDIGLIVPGGSSGERLLPVDVWIEAARRVSGAMGITQWTVCVLNEKDGAALAAALPNARLLCGRQTARLVVDTCRSAAVVLGVSTAIPHLAALTGTPALIVEHPTTIPWLYRAPVPFVQYLRPEHPWWCDDPTDADLDRAFAIPADTYGFLPGEWLRQIEEALAQSPFTDDKKKVRSHA
jgi:hypothetical protein